MKLQLDLRRGYIERKMFFHNENTHVLETGKKLAINRDSSKR